jgi:hypothetical protein
LAVRAEAGDVPLLLERIGWSGVGDKALVDEPALLC